MPEDVNNPSATASPSAAADSAPAASPPKPAPRPAEQVGLRVSLIPADEMNQQDPKAGFKKCLIAVAVAVAVIGGICGYLGYLTHTAKQSVAEIDAQTEIYNKQSAELATSVSGTKLIQARLKALGSLLGAHRSVAPIFAFVERHTLQDVSLSSISIAENGGVNLVAAGSSYESYAGQINELRALPEIKSLSASGLAPNYGQDGALTSVNFTLSLSFDPSIFLIQKP